MKLMVAAGIIRKQSGQATTSSKAYLYNWKALYSSKSNSQAMRTGK